MRFPGQLYFTSGVIASLACALLLVAAVEAVETVRDSLPGIEQFEQRISSLDENTKLEEATREKLKGLYQRARDELQKAQTHRQSTQVFIEEGAAAAADRKRSQDNLLRLQQSAVDKGLNLAAKTSLESLEQQVQSAKAAQSVSLSGLDDLRKEHEYLLRRPAEIRQRLIAIAREQDTLREQLEAAQIDGESAQLSEARRWVIQAQSRVLESETRMLDQELLTHASRLQALEAQLELAEFQHERSIQRTRLVEGTLSDRRLADAERTRQETEAIKQGLQNRHPLVQRFASDNTALADNLKQHVVDLERVTERDARIRSLVRQVNADLDLIRQKLEIAGLSKTLGRVLLEQRRSLPQLAEIMNDAETTEKQLAESGLRQIQYSEMLRKLRNIDQYILQQPGQQIDQLEPELFSELQDLARQRKNLVERLASAETSLRSALGELDLVQRRLIEAISDFDAFLNQRLLWIPNTEPLSIDKLLHVPEDIVMVFDPAVWLNSLARFAFYLGDHLLTAILLLFIAGITFSRQFCLTRLVETGKKVGRIRTDSFVYTLHALGWTLLASIPLPLLFYAIGWQVSLAAGTDAFLLSLGVALQRTATDFLILLFFYNVTIEGGLLTRHFRWSGDSIALLRRELRLLMLLFLPLVFFALLITGYDRENYGGAFGMLVVITAIGMIGLFFYRIFNARDGGVLALYIARHPQSLLSRLRLFWFLLLLLYLGAMALLVAAGYLYSGGTLTRLMFNTAAMLGLLALAHGLGVRWLLLVRGRLAFQARLERIEEARAQRLAQQQTDEQQKAASEDMPEIDEPEVDLQALDSDSRKLLNTSIFFTGVISLWLIWTAAFPAFGFLDGISLWTYTETVDGVDRLMPITLADIALIVIIVIITASAARGLPAFLEFFLLQRISITAGARYTATTLMRYTIVGIGAMLVFSSLGVSWSKIQWLVAALGVGIGFGLQEIIANFISGLIILFERPIRVGDVVTVGDTSGVVTRIEIRATTITNWDRQELLVPNKEFITGRLLNWSLSDPITRVRIVVGIAYGSDVVKALELLNEVAREHSNVLEDPSPLISFDSFGDNSLNLQLRAYLPSMENRINTVSELNLAINSKFEAAGIVIAFPQRDVHLDISGPLDVRLNGDELSVGRIKRSASDN